MQQLNCHKSFMGKKEDWTQEEYPNHKYYEGLLMFRALLRRLMEWLSAEYEEIWLPQVRTYNLTTDGSFNKIMTTNKHPNQQRSGCMLCLNLRMSTCTIAWRMVSKNGLNITGKDSEVTKYQLCQLGMHYFWNWNSVSVRYCTRLHKNCSHTNNIWYHVILSDVIQAYAS